VVMKVRNIISAVAWFFGGSFCLNSMFRYFDTARIIRSAKVIAVFCELLIFIMQSAFLALELIIIILIHTMHYVTKKHSALAKSLCLASGPLGSESCSHIAQARRGRIADFVLFRCGMLSGFLVGGRVRASSLHRPDNQSKQSLDWLSVRIRPRNKNTPVKWLENFYGST